jgi:hypothetical protein
VLRRCKIGLLLTPLLATALLESQQNLLSGQLRVTVTDQNGQPLPSVFVIARQNNKVVAQERTTPSGEATLPRLAAGSYSVVVEKQGFYTASVDNVTILAGQTTPLEVRVQPVREYRTEIEVAAEPSPIDPQQSASTETLTADEIATIPYPTTRDYRNVLPFVPGVIQDTGGQIHVAGSSTQEVEDYVDGFEVSQPAAGNLEVRVNPDTLRKIDVVSSRYSAMFGKGSGGLTDLTVQDGDNRFRYNATDFIPTVQNVKGIQFNNWTPRAYISGPIVDDKVWFMLSHEGEFDRNIVKQLPDGADTNNLWRTADMARVRMNLTQGNVLTLSSLLNVQHSNDAGISPFDPVSVSTNQHTTLYLLTAKDQLTVARGSVFEFGAGFERTDTSDFPQGLSAYVFAPTGRTGNFFETSGAISERTQGFSNFFLRPLKKYGTHQVTLGGRMDRVLLDQLTSRVPTDFVDSSNTLLRQITFQNLPAFGVGSLESSAYLQDRWSVRENLLVEAGGRWDRDGLIGRDFFSPRIAGTFLAHPATETKFSAGVGIYYDRTNLNLISQSLQGTVTDQFFSPVPQTLITSFVVDPSRLTMPRFVNWSAAIESRLPWKIYGRMEVLSRHGVHGWAYEQQPSGAFLLETNRQDHYDAIQFSVRKEWKRGYPVLISYTRSRARSNETVDFSLDNFIVGNQLPGPLPWDAPNLLQSWGSTPLAWKFKKFDLAYSAIWRSGFPFFTVNQFGQLVSGPGQFRFPDFFTLNVAVERKFIFKGYYWALRIGSDDITNRQNAAVVDNNIDSPTFLTFFGQSHRTFNGRIRFLGKVK